MKLKTFEKVNTSRKTRYIVYYGFSYQTEFSIDYTRDDMLANAPAVALKEKYRDAKVINVDNLNGTLYVTIDIKGVQA